MSRLVSILEDNFGWLNDMVILSMVTQVSNTLEAYKSLQVALI